MRDARRLKDKSVNLAAAALFKILLHRRGRVRGKRVKTPERIFNHIVRESVSTLIRNGLEFADKLNKQVMAFSRRGQLAGGHIIISAGRSQWRYKHELAKRVAADVVRNDNIDACVTQLAGDFIETPVRLICIALPINDAKQIAGLRDFSRTADICADINAAVEHQASRQARCKPFACADDIEHRNDDAARVGRPVDQRHDFID